jgi:UDP-N-acetylmuramate--alanine ligase
MTELKVAESVGLPPAPGPIHFVGIGGIGMSALARILLAWGYRVTGSDASASDVTSALQAEGIEVGIGHNQIIDAVNAALVVVTAAVRRDNPELAAAIVARVPVVKRAQLLGMLANAKRCVAVAGSHGKSTTSGMIATALLQLGAEPSYAIGAVVTATGTNAAPGNGEAMVVEADEYDYSFLWLQPDVAVITNIEYDHPDLFPDQATYDQAFADFASKLRAGGTLIISKDDLGCARLVELLRRSDISVTTFGLCRDADWKLAGAEGNWRIIDPSRDQHVIDLAVPGRHNALNATAAAAAVASLGFSAEEAVSAVQSYQGVGRRFETKGEANGILVIDDYAHHPTEVNATLHAAKERYPARRLWAVFQPHTYSRTKALLNEFAQSFDYADRIVILDIYPSRETDSLGVSSADLLRLFPVGALAGGSPATAVEMLSNQVEQGDVVVTLGAGDITKIGPQLLEKLRSEAGSA